MSAVNGLVLGRRVPPWIHQVNVRRDREVESDAACLERDQDHRDGRLVLEGVEDILSSARGHAAIELDDSNAADLQTVLDDVEEGDELGEDDGLC